MLKFSTDSSIHGINFIFNSSHNKFIKIFWISALLLSFCGFSFYIREAYIKWQFTPDIMMITRELPSKDFPMPAVTFCPFPYVKRVEMNLSEFYSSGDLNYDENCDKILKFSWCNYWLLEDFGECKNFEEKKLKIIKLLKETELEYRELNLAPLEFYEENLAKIYFYHGICYVWNMADPKDIFNDFNNFDEFFYVKKISPKLQWTPEKGFETQNAEFPERARKAFLQDLFTIVKRFNLSENCKRKLEISPPQIIFHLPTEFPTRSHEMLDSKSEDSVNLHYILNLKSLRTNKYLRKFSPHHRKCFFEDERKLKFFKIYSKTHCEIECEYNRILKTCGCSNLFTFKEKSVRFCNTSNDDRCLEDEMRTENLNQSKSMLPCDCYPACNSVKYSFEVIESQQASVYPEW